MNYTINKGRVSLCSGFTLVEILTVVLIVAVLASLALPMYMKTVERSRATEAMSAIKAMNDSIYAYFVEKEVCPDSFDKLVSVIPDGNCPAAGPCRTVNGKHFQFQLPESDARVPTVPGTNCVGIKAVRINGGDYNYAIWNPYVRSSDGDKYALACDALGSGEAARKKNVAVCQSLGIYQPDN